MKAILKLLSSRYIFYFLLITWVGNIIFSATVLPPGDDLGEYFLSSLGILYKFQNGMYYGNEFTSKYYLLPGFSFFQGLFLHLTSLLHIPNNLYTYKLFQSLLISTLIILSLYLISNIHRRNYTEFLTHSNIFLITLSITPFAQQCWLIRPEVLGLVFMVIGLILYQKWELAQVNSNWPFYLSALFLGFSTTVHLNFVIIVSIVILAILLLNFRKLHSYQLILFVFIALIPFLIVMWWYWIHYPESIQELGAVLKLKASYGTVYGAGIVKLVKEALMLGRWDSFFIKVYYFIFWFPLFLLFLTIPVLIWKYALTIIKKDRFNVLLISLFCASITILILDKKGCFWYFTIVSFFTTLLFPIFLTSYKTLCPGINSPSRKFSILITFGLILTVSSHSLIHTTKFIFSSKQYYYAPKTHSAVSMHLNPGDTLFLTTGRLIGTFFELFDGQYRGTSSIQVYHTLPQTYLECKARKMEAFLHAAVQNISHENTVWGMIKKRTSLDRNHMNLVSNVCFGIRCLELNFKVKEILYEDKAHIFFRPVKIKVVEE